MTWVSCGLSSAEGTIGLKALRGLFHLTNSMILASCVSRQ